ncbi:MAG: twin-arginine translocation signal domain-containing protein, partial [Phycisphaerae bacterium]|nr:twin-arginine translocation signal domain-containing protein [Phycisphaerae bacterium]
MNRREFLRYATAGALAAAGAALLPGCTAPAPSSRPALPPLRDRKLIIVLFGGGTRSSESIDDPKHRWVPHLWADLVPHGTLFTNMRVEGKIVHPNSAGSIVTGHWEWGDLDWSQPVAHPTVFEIARRQNGADAWAFVYASILANIGHSRADGFGQPFAANIVEPPTIPRSTAERMDRLMQHAATAPEGLGDAARRAAELARTTSRINLAGLRTEAARAFVQRHYERWKSGGGTTSHDAFLAELAIAAMTRFAPAVSAVCFGEIDCAHYGSWSRYVEAIERTDALVWRLWRAAQELDGYRGRTVMLVLPDHGRELDRPGGAGFVHHSDFYTGAGVDEGCRRVWMLAIGPGVA